MQGNMKQVVRDELVYFVVPKSGDFKNTVFVKVREDSVKGYVKGKIDFTKTPVS